VRHVDSTHQRRQEYYLNLAASLLQRSCVYSVNGQRSCRLSWFRVQRGQLSRWRQSPGVKVHSSIKTLALEKTSTDLRSMMATVVWIAWFSMNTRDGKIKTHKIDNYILRIISRGVGSNYGYHSGWIYRAGFYDDNHDRRKSRTHSNLFQQLLALPNLECDEPCRRLRQSRMNIT
jgi:hypothetical protein